MKKTIVIYQSKYGTTQRYAEWLAEAMQCEVINKKHFSTKRFADYDNIVYGGFVYASGIKGLSLLKDNVGKLAGKRVVCFAVGAAPEDEANIAELRRKNMTGSLADVKLFYCRGALVLNRLKGADKLMMNMFQKMVSKKDPATLEPSEASFLENLNNGEDWTNKDNLEPLISYLHG